EIRLAPGLEPCESGLAGRLKDDELAAIPGAVREDDAAVEADRIRLAGIDRDRQRTRHQRVQRAAMGLCRTAQALEVVVGQLVGDGANELRAAADQALDGDPIEVAERAAAKSVRVGSGGKNRDLVRW